MSRASAQTVALPTRASACASSGYPTPTSHAPQFQGRSLRPRTRRQEENSPAFSSIVRSHGMSFFARAQNVLRCVQHYRLALPRL